MNMEKLGKRTLLELDFQSFSPVFMTLKSFGMIAIARLSDFQKSLLTLFVQVDYNLSYVFNERTKFFRMRILGHSPVSQSLICVQCRADMTEKRLYCFITPDMFHY